MQFSGLGDLEPNKITLGRRTTFTERMESTKKYSNYHLAVICCIFLPTWTVVKAFHPNSQIHTWALLIVPMKLRVWSIEASYATACGNTKTLRSFRIKPRHPPTVPWPTKTLAKFKVVRATNNIDLAVPTRSSSICSQSTIAVTILEFCQAKVVLIRRCVKFALRPGGRGWSGILTQHPGYGPLLWAYMIKHTYNKEWQRHDDLDR